MPNAHKSLIDHCGSVLCSLKNFIKNLCLFLKRCLPTLGNTCDVVSKNLIYLHLQMYLSLNPSLTFKKADFILYPKLNLTNLFYRYLCFIGHYDCVFIFINSSYCTKMRHIFATGFSIIWNKICDRHRFI